MNRLRAPLSFSHPFRGPRVRSPLFGLIVLVGFSGLSVTAAAQVSVHTPDEVLAEWTVRSGGALFFKAPGGVYWEFVDDINDPVILNKGAGSFFPLDPEVVRDALDAVTFPTRSLSLDIFILPFPRRGLLPSNADSRCIYLSPGVAPLSVQQVHALIAHEMGHIVHHQLLPDSDEAGWAAYRRIRGIEDKSVYHESALHRDRPHEIFAEDFRFLFGGSLANYAGSIENPTLPLPNQVPGLSDFFASLHSTAGIIRDVVAVRRLLVYPNPTRGAVQISFAREEDPVSDRPLTVTVYDVRGRLVSRREAFPGSALSWEGRTLDGGPAPSGIYFVEIRDGAQRWVGKIIVDR